MTVGNAEKLLFKDLDFDVDTDVESVDCPDEILAPPKKKRLLKRSNAMVENGFRCLFDIGYWCCELYHGMSQLFQSKTDVLACFYICLRFNSRSILCLTFLVYWVYETSIHLCRVGVCA